MSSNICLIITVPHALKCDKKSKGHPCDSLSVAMANIIKSEAIKRAKFKEVWETISEKPRTYELDMNRINSRSEKFRVDIMKKIKDSISRGIIVWVLDIHSFPPDYYPYNDAKFTILDTRYGDYNNITSYVLKFIEFSHNKISIQTLAGSDPWSDQTNDIMDTSRELGAKSFLIETIENLTDTDGHLFANLLLDFILQYK